jgi:hypothetical protein
MDSDAMVMVLPVAAAPPSRGVPQCPAVSRKFPQVSSMVQQWSSKFQQIPAKSRNVPHAGRAGPCWTMLDYLRDTSHDSTKK